MFSKISWLDFFVIPHCNLQFERMSKSTISIEYIRSCHKFFSNNKVQFFHLCLNRQLSIYTRIFHWKIFDSVTYVKRFKIRYCKTVPLASKSLDLQAFYLSITTGSFSAIRVSIEGFEVVANYSIKKLSILFVASKCW